MRKQTEYLVIGIGITSILAGIYGGFRSGELMDSLNGVLIGVALIGTIIIERNKKKVWIKTTKCQHRIKLIAWL